MDNTVGSQKNLTSKQKEVLMGALLGDGALELNGRYPRLRIDHAIKQKSYVEWKYEIFRGLTTRGIKQFSSKLDSRTKKRYSHCKFDTISTPLLNEFYEIFYALGKKRKKKIPNDIVTLLRNPLSLAVWYMDDGYKRNDCNALRISTDGFTFEEQKLLQKCLKRNFEIETKLHRKGRYWNIYIPNSQVKNFCSIVKPYIISEMNYKIFLTP